VNERKLALLRKRAEKRKELEAQQAGIAQSLKELNEKELKVDLPELPAPIVHNEFDTKELAEIANKTSAQLEALQDKLDPEMTIAAFGELKSEISTLKSVFGHIEKALEQDIYARYDYANSIEENGVRYIGYLNKDSNWFIQRLGKSTEGESSTFATGKAGAYKQAWKNRLMLKYVPRDKATIV